jgi:hypothetical protein
MNAFFWTSRLAIAATAGLVCFTATAETQSQELYRSGLWSAYRASDERGPFCGVATGGGEGRRVAIHQSAGESGVSLQLSKGSWVIPDNTPVSVQFRFDNRDESPGQAIGRGQTITEHLNFEQSVSFMRTLRNGRVMQVIFPDGNETVWTGGLAGSGNAINAFNSCRASLAPAAPTQPYSPQSTHPSPQSTQPSPQPTQPSQQPTQPQAQQMPPVLPPPVQP